MVWMLRRARSGSGPLDLIRWGGFFSLFLVVSTKFNM